jgi:hypothetical protein
MEYIAIALLLGIIGYIIYNNKKGIDIIDDGILTEEEMANMSVQELVDYANKKWKLELPYTVSRATVLDIIRQRQG